jgi:hypothetical protein
LTIFLIENENESYSVCDDELNLLSEALEMYDEKISEIDAQIKMSRSPSDEGLCDRGEYFIGLGFIAIQCYFDAVINQFNITKKTAFDLPPTYDKINATFAELINAGANHAKHLNEWWKVANDNKIIDKKIEMNITSIAKVTDEVLLYYPKSNILAAILCESSDKDKDLTLTNLIPIIEQWRLHVLQHIKRIDTNN